MKRTPLRRSTKPIKRTRLKPWRRDEDDKMTPEVRAAIINRDRMCFIYAFVDHAHICRDVWGDPHMPDDLLRLTVEHVKKELAMGVRAKSRIEFGLALCHKGNVDVPSAKVREKMRERLAGLYPEVWARG